MVARRVLQTFGKAKAVTAPVVVVFLRLSFTMAGCARNKRPAREITPPTFAGLKHLAAHGRRGNSLQRSET